MPSYKVIKEGATLPKRVSERKSRRDPEKVIYLSQSIVYHEGQIISENDLTPELVEKYNEGDESIRNLIEEISESQPKKKAASKKKSTK